LARATRHQAPLGLIMLDVDHFKHFNDEFGHRAGDSALIEISGLLTRTIRAEDVACRYGGEEFAVILPGAALDVTMRRANEIGSAAREMVLLERTGAPRRGLPVSMGVAAFPEHGVTLDSLIRAADVAMMAAKVAGRDRVCVAAAIDPPPNP
jgi:diguanylate cyclase (GGDEF)-like protein